MRESSTGKMGGIGKARTTEERLDRIETMLAELLAQQTKASELTTGATAAVAVATDMVDDLMRERGETLKASERGEAALCLLERISRPETLATLTNAIDLLENAPNALATLTDAFDERLAAIQDGGAPLYARLDSLASILERASRPAVLEQLDKLIDGLTFLAPAIQAALEDDIGRAGLLDLWRASKDPDVQHATHRAICVARAIGQAARERNGKLLTTEVSS